MVRVVCYEQRGDHTGASLLEDMYEYSMTVVRISSVPPLVMDRLRDEVRQKFLWTVMFADDICSEKREQTDSLERWRYIMEKRVKISQ